jgi:hypothetical protein
MFENRVLKRISGPKREEERGGYRRLLSEALHNLYLSLMYCQLSVENKTR